jgi:hypothetical protein
MSILLVDVLTLGAADFFSIDPLSVPVVRDPVAFVIRTYLVSGFHD